MKNKEKRFYYSKKQAEHMSKPKLVFITDFNGDSVPINSETRSSMCEVDGKTIEYTEVVDADFDYEPKWDDSVLVATGIPENIRKSEFKKL